MSAQVKTDFSKYETVELQKMLHVRRKTLMAVRAEMDEIEAVLLPRLTKESAISKIKRAGLTEAEVKALIQNGNT